MTSEQFYQKELELILNTEKFIDKIENTGKKIGEPNTIDIREYILRVFFRIFQICPNVLE